MHTALRLPSFSGTHGTVRRVRVIIPTLGMQTFVVTWRSGKMCATRTRVKIRAGFFYGVADQRPTERLDASKRTRRTTVLRRRRRMGLVRERCVEPSRRGKTSKRLKRRVRRVLRKIVGVNGNVRPSKNRKIKTVIVIYTIRRDVIYSCKRYCFRETDNPEHTDPVKRRSPNRFVRTV